MLSLRHFGPGSLDPLGRVGAENLARRKMASAPRRSQDSGISRRRFSFIDFLRVNLSCPLNARARAFPKFSSAGAGWMRLPDRAAPAV